MDSFGDGEATGATKAVEYTHTTSTTRARPHSQTERLYQQFHDVDAVHSRLLEGMVFHVNGHTDVPIEELRRQIVLHGGRIEQYSSSR